MSKAKRPREPRWVSKRATLAIHDLLLAAHGGARGMVDPHLLDSALDSPRNHFQHGQADVFELTGIYAFALTQNHPFVDGNKRVAFTVAVTFLEMNGFRLVGAEHEAVQIVLDLSSGRADASAFASWLRENAQPLVAERARSRKPASRRRVAKRK